METNRQVLARPRFRSSTCRSVAVLVLLLACQPAHACGPDMLERAVVRSVEQGDVLLHDGRRLRLAGLEAIGRTELALAQLLGIATTDSATGQSSSRPAGTIDVLVGIIGEAEDRWGRLPAIVFTTAVHNPVNDRSERAPPDPVFLQALLLEAGEARVQPTSLAPPCRSLLLAAEQRAREQRLGLWSDPAYAVLDSFDRGRIAAQIGRQVVTEGRITRVSEGRRMIFADVRSESGERLTVALDRRQAQRLVALGLPAVSAWRGRRLRLRGRLEAGRQVLLRVPGPDSVELAQ